MNDLDQYNTPDHVADLVVENSGVTDLRKCADTACGTGNLLRAAERAYPDVLCVGIEKDKELVRRLRRQHTKWLLSNADIFNSVATSRSQALSLGRNCDLLFLNPPFSARSVRTTKVLFHQRELRCSIAMGHLLTSLELMQPSHGAVAIVPESMLFSDVDAYARMALSFSYEMKVCSELRNTTFTGARVNAAIVRISPNNSKSETGRKSRTRIGSNWMEDYRIVRGGVPTYQAEYIRRGGMPYIHTTDFRPLIERKLTQPKLSQVRPLERGHVSGHVVLLPRVGMPQRDLIRALYIPLETQLSDCVIAIQSKNGVLARKLATAMRTNFGELTAIYHGTGARFTTREKVETLMGRIVK